MIASPETASAVFARTLAVAGASVGTIVGASAWAVRGRASQVFGPSIYCGSSAERTIALTFDDGPSEGTLPLLAYLAEQGIAATFFQCGSNVRRLPQVAREVHGAGHEIGNHTYSHARLCPTILDRMRWPTKLEIYEELARAQEVFATEIRIKPTLFRAPFGARWFGLREAQQRLGLTGVMWTCIANDWKLPADRIARRVLDSAIPGGIVCFHDGRGIVPRPDLTELLPALKQVLPMLRERGYSFKTVSELAAAELALKRAEDLPAKSF